MKIHKSLTVDVVFEAAKAQMTSLDNPGFCVACGAEAYACEPDLRRGFCESCEKQTVYGAAELLQMIS